MMSEKKLVLEDISPIDLYGVNDTKLELIKNRFPKLKIVARGEVIKASGEEEELNQLEMVLNIMIGKGGRFILLFNEVFDFFLDALRADIGFCRG